MSVYFITCRETSTVKIGNSGSPHGRLRDLQTMCPLPLALEAVLPGRHKQEFALHRQFANDRLRGEWFRLSEQIEAIIAANPPMPELPPSIPDPGLVVKPRWQTDRERSERFLEKYQAAQVAAGKSLLAKKERAGDIHFPFRKASA